MGQNPWKSPQASGIRGMYRVSSVIYNVILAVIIGLAVKKLGSESEIHPVPKFGSVFFHQLRSPS